MRSAPTRGRGFDALRDAGGMFDTDPTFGFFQQPTTEFAIPGSAHL
jgi:hypothetical protein